MPSPPPDANTQRLLASLPAIHRLVASDEMKTAVEQLPAAVVTDAARRVLERVRCAILQNGGASIVPDEAALSAEAAREALRSMQPSLRYAVNATGIVLHTGLGRARLADAAREALANIAGGHSTVEIDQESGRRGSRRDHVRSLLCELTGAEDAMVVNNCAGAVFLAVTALAAGREAIISRGELVEIGGAFRMPDIIRASGAALVEVGTTNRTRVEDYAAAITDRTGLILRCHPSNFAIVGFTEAARTADLVQLGRTHGIPVMDDQGSGSLVPLETLGIAQYGGTLRDSVAAGCDVVTASGDKLLGGPQAGIVLGSRTKIEVIASHPLARALRVDKFTLAALEATLRLYRDPESALDDIPTLRYLSRGLPELTVTAEALRSRIAAVLGAGFTVATVPEQSQVGGGSVPGEELPTMCVAIRSATGILSPDAISARLRGHDPPIFARIKSDAVLLDPRTLESDEIDFIVDAARALAG